MSLYAGDTLVVVLNGYENIRDCFQRMADNFTDRPTNYLIHQVFRGKGNFVIFRVYI